MRNWIDCWKRSGSGRWPPHFLGDRLIDELDRVGQIGAAAGDIRPRPESLLQRRQQPLRAERQRTQDRQRRADAP